MAPEIRPQRSAAHRGVTGDDSALLRALLQDGSAAFALYDADGRYRQVSRALADLNHLPVERHLGRRPAEVLDGQIAGQVESALSRVLADGSARREHEERVPDPEWGGGPRYLDTHWSALRDSDGRINGALAVVHDVTDRHRIAELLGSTQWRIGKLQTVARELAGALTIAEVRAAVAKLAQVTGASHVDLRLFDAVGHSPWPLLEGAGRRVPAQRSANQPPEDRWDRRTASWPPLLAAAVRAGQARYLPNRAAAAAAFAEVRAEDLPGGGSDADGAGAESGENAWAVLPLVTAAGPVGGLYLVYDQERPFDEDDQAYLQALAGQCTMAVARARMHEREHRQVLSLQEALLPKRLPDVPGVDAAFRYIPGSLDTEVGGDWYDLFAFRDGRLGMVVGDVIGKGVTAAAGMGRVRAALRALAFTDPSPRAVITGLDRLFDATENAESLTTVSYAVIDPSKNMLVLSDAGHLPLLVLTANEGAHYVDATPEATPLGLSEERVEHEITLRPGDIVMGFSDGLVEIRTASLDDGLDRLRRAVLSAPDRALEPLLDHVVETMLRDQEQDDDVTLLAVRVQG
jgi:PAS domain S-box-containing protein